MSTTPPPAIAVVQWWNQNLVHILCSFCDKIHQHGFTGCDVDQQYRGAYCSYRFPRDPGGVSLPEQTPRDQLENLKTRFREAVDAKPLWGDVGGAQREEMDRIVSNMVRGVLEPLLEFLTDNRGNLIHSIFLNGVESWNPPPDTHSHEDDEGEDENTQSRPTSGKTVLQLAACESYPEVVRLLLKAGADANSADLDGRTPLMEAALWGRLENVERLLEHGADADLLCIDNDTLRRAADFAKPKRENYETRRSKRLYKENVCQMDIHRREIVRLLEGQTVQPAQPPMQLDGFSFSCRSNDARSLSLTTRYSLPTEWKTVARLIRGGNFPEMSAMSGWGHDEDELIHVAGQEWTSWVLVRLLEAGCPGVDAEDIDGWTPLAWAIHTDSPDTVQTLISNENVLIERRDKGGRTALSWAVEYGHIEVVKVLLRAGADTGTQTGSGRTPAMIAKDFGRDDIVKELEVYGP
ncbi:ankyrin repeat-containing protein [Fusarium bulbicola]|nr:ankyrin repeat-containing protein [Fusarium bulbicola]